jgi:hypothetical protein
MVMVMATGEMGREEMGRKEMDDGKEAIMEECGRVRQLCHTRFLLFARSRHDTAILCPATSEQITRREKHGYLILRSTIKERQDNRVIQEIIPVIELIMEALHKRDRYTRYAFSKRNEKLKKPDHFD